MCYKQKCKVVSLNLAHPVDPYCQQQRCEPLNVIFNITFLALICLRFRC